MPLDNYSILKNDSIKQVKECLFTVQKKKDKTSKAEKGKIDVAFFRKKTSIIYEFCKVLQQISMKYYINHGYNFLFLHPQYLSLETCGCIYKQCSGNKPVQFLSSLLLSLQNIGICEEYCKRGYLVCANWFESISNFFSIISENALCNNEFILSSSKVDYFPLLMQKPIVMITFLCTPNYRVSQDSTLTDQKDINEYDTVSSENFQHRNLSGEHTFNNIPTMVTSGSNTFISSLTMPIKSRKKEQCLDGDAHVEKISYRSEIELFLDNKSLLISMKPVNISIPYKCKDFIQGPLFLKNESVVLTWEMCDSFKPIKTSVAGNYTFKEIKFYFTSIVSNCIYFSQQTHHDITYSLALKLNSLKENVFSCRDNHNGRLRVHFKNDIEEIDPFFETEFYDESLFQNNQNITASPLPFYKDDIMKRFHNVKSQKNQMNSIEDSLIDKVFIIVHTDSNEIPSESSDDNSKINNDYDDVYMNRKTLAVIKVGDYFNDFSETTPCSESVGALPTTFSNISDIPTFDLIISRNTTEEEMSIAYKSITQTTEEVTSTASDKFTADAELSDNICNLEFHFSQNYSYVVSNIEESIDKEKGMIIKNKIVKEKLKTLEHDLFLKYKKRNENSQRYSQRLLTSSKYTLDNIKETENRKDYNYIIDNIDIQKTKQRKEKPLWMNKTWFSLLNEKFNYKKRVLHSDPTLKENNCMSKDNVLLNAFYSECDLSFKTGHLKSHLGFNKFFSDTTSEIVINPFPKEIKYAFDYLSHNFSTFHSGINNDKRKVYVPLIFDKPLHNKMLYNHIKTLINNLQLQRYSQAAISYKIIKAKEIITKLQKIFLKNIGYLNSFKEILFQILLLVDESKMMLQRNSVLYENMYQIKDKLSLNIMRLMSSKITIKEFFNYSSADIFKEENNDVSIFISNSFTSSKSFTNTPVLNQLKESTCQQSESCAREFKKKSGNHFRNNKEKNALFQKNYNSYYLRKDQSKSYIKRNPYDVGLNGKTKCVTFSKYETVYSNLYGKSFSKLKNKTKTCRKVVMKRSRNGNENNADEKQVQNWLLVNNLNVQEKESHVEKVLVLGENSSPYIPNKFYSETAHSSKYRLNSDNTKLIENHIFHQQISANHSSISHSIKKKLARCCCNIRQKRCNANLDLSSTSYLNQDSIYECLPGADNPKCMKKDNT